MVRSIHACLLSFAFAALTCASSGCSGDDDNHGHGHGDPADAGNRDSGSQGSQGTPAPEQACLDLEKAVTNAATRCSFSQQEVQQLRDYFIQNVHGSCANVVDIRDESSLRSQCLPSFDNMTCDTFTSGTWDASCSGQLLVSGSTMSAPSTIVESSTVESSPIDQTLRRSMSTFSSTIR